MTKYDSETEQKLHEQYPELTPTNDEYLFGRSVFTDRNGERFSAKADYRADDRNLIIESKSCKLNDTLSKEDEYARKQEYKKTDSRGNWRNRKIMLDNGWNHSLYKQQIVSDYCYSKGFEYVVIFDDSTRLARGSKGKADRYFIEEQRRYSNLNWMFASEAEYLLGPDYKEIVEDEELEDATKNAHLEK